MNKESKVKAILNLLGNETAYGLWNYLEYSILSRLRVEIQCYEHYPTLNWEWDGVGDEPPYMEERGTRIFRVSKEIYDLLASNPEREHWHTTPYVEVYKDLQKKAVIYLKNGYVVSMPEGWVLHAVSPQGYHEEWFFKSLEKALEYLTR